MLDGITKALTDVFKGITGNAHISENNVKKALADIRVALLEADVNIKIVRSFINEVTESALGEKVLRSVDPGQQFVKIVHDKLVELLGDKAQDIKKV